MVQEKVQQTKIDMNQKIISKYKNLQQYDHLLIIYSILQHDHLTKNIKE